MRGAVLGGVIVKHLSLVVSQLTSFVCTGRPVSERTKQTPAGWQTVLYPATKPGGSATHLSVAHSEVQSCPTTASSGFLLLAGSLQWRKAPRPIKSRLTMVTTSAEPSPAPTAQFSISKPITRARLLPNGQQFRASHPISRYTSHPKVARCCWEQLRPPIIP